ncbi:hypothetical protein SAMD00023353_0802850 [Rosellinia necatrix]|uniref:Uncharacterized protein n=1 Tax=Rosellinia necatrix TaxID=77044 RepID=A0A1W2TBD4_ROSNE|nr:hypothetical protein SAMD00023353_0802850 [Rosellinia necatrix]
MASITDQLRSAASRNEELLRILSDTDNAPSALEQQKRYIRDLSSQIDDVTKRLEGLKREKSKEQKDHEKYRDSVMKRWAYKVTGKQDKFAAKAEKEEKEYFDVLQKLHQATTLEENLNGMKAEALGAQQKVEQECARRAMAQGALDSLYSDIFQGPTPSFPEEDAAERAVEAAQRAHGEACARLEAERQVARILGEARKRIRAAMADIEDALDASRLDMFGVGGAGADAMERSSLHTAEMGVMQAQMLILQAQNASPDGAAAVAGLPPVRIAQGSLVSDVLFDNIFTDMAFHDKIKDSREEVLRCDHALVAQIAVAGDRCQAAEQLSKTRSEALSTARAALQKARQAIFERLAAGGDVPKAEAGVSAMPPAYS